MSTDQRSLTVLLPGIGYTCDRPLLYYSGRLARALGWEVLPVPYGGFPPKVRGDRERLMQSAEIACAKTEEMLRDVDWKAFRQILFISKSIGTVAATAYAHAHGLPCRHILFTPVEETFDRPIRDAIAFHGTADPWADTARITLLCGKAGIPLYVTQDANHSLETGDVARDLRNLEAVMRQVRAYIPAQESTGKNTD